MAKRQNQRYFSRKNGERNGRYSQEIYSSPECWSPRKRTMQTIQYMQKYRLQLDKIVFADNITAHKIYQLEREIQSLRTENEIFKRSGCGLNSSLDEKITAIEQLKNDFSIYAICKTLNILRSTYYHRVLRSPEKTQYEIAVTALKIIIIALLIMRYCFQIKHNTEGAITGMKSRILKTILAI